METLLVAGSFYLIVIAIILTIKPSFMFTEDGYWKEFGIGRNPKTHTWMPFWFFAILTALVSYILAILLLRFRTDTSTTNIASTTPQVEVKKTVSVKAKSPEILDEVVEVNAEDFEPPVVKPRRRTPRVDLPDGYYMLNQQATDAAGGIPKYIYLGKDME
jgi:hypothetical protein